MVAEQQDGLFPLLQFIALALPAIAIYLQVLVSIYQTEQNIEIEGRVPRAVDSGGTRVPENDPNVIEALPALVTEANSRVDFLLALLSLAFFLFAALALAIRLLVVWDVLMLVGTSLALIATGLFAISIPVTGWNSAQLI